MCDGTEFFLTAVFKGRCSAVCIHLFDGTLLAVKFRKLKINIILKRVEAPKDSNWHHTKQAYSDALAKYCFFFF